MTTSLISRAVSQETTSPALAWPSSIRLATSTIAVEHAEAGVGHVVHGRVRGDAELGGDVAGGRRLELLAADARRRSARRCPPP